VDVEKRKKQPSHHPPLLNVLPQTRQNPIVRRQTMADSGGGGGAGAPAPGGAPRKEIYTYTAPWTVFAMAWANR